MNKKSAATSDSPSSAPLKKAPVFTDHTPIRAPKGLKSNAQPRPSGAPDAVKSPSSAHEVINSRAAASPKTTSASSLHQKATPDNKASNRPRSADSEEEVRSSVSPSASAILRPAKSSKAASQPIPVVRTSLKLNPKKPPLVSPKQSRSDQTKRQLLDGGLRNAKGQTKLSRAIAAAKANLPSPTPPQAAPRPVHSTNPHAFQDIIRPKPAQTPPVVPVEDLEAISKSSAPSHTAKPRSAAAAPSRFAAQASKPARPAASSLRPLDSIKRRFRPAPKDYAVPTSEARPPKPAVHFYGNADMPEPTFDTPYWVHHPTEAEPISPSEADALAASAAHLAPDHQPAQKTAHTPDSFGYQDSKSTHTPDAPDNNRYVLGARSPFFLSADEISVEKRPLSSDPTRRSVDTENPIYSAQNLDATPKKNRYEKKSPKKSSTPKPKSVKPAKSETTVIIPARSRSRVPLFLLLIVTVILGAIVGGLVYLCFFQ